MLELRNVTKTFGKHVAAVADVAARPDAIRNRLGYLPRDFGVYRNVTALEFMRYFAALKGVRDPARSRASRAWKRR
jgi:ABC-type uncharacterized transport system ATPase subunit